MTRDSWGRALPAELPRAARIDLLRRVAGALMANSDPTCVWLGRSIARAFADGISIDDALGIAPIAGSTATPRRVIRREHVNRLLLRLSHTVGTDVRASAILVGKESCPDDARELVAQLHQLGAPTSVFSFTRARRQLSRP